jgi:hypothetical protein
MRAFQKLAVVCAVAGVAGMYAAVPAHAATAVSVRQTRVEHFKVPGTYEIHGTFEASGTVQKLDGKDWQAAASATVAIYDRSLPTGKWVHAGTVKTGSNGTFAWKSGIHRLGRFAWQARVEQTTVGSTEYKASESAAANSLFADRTYVTEFVALHLDGDTGLGAIIQDYPQSGGVSYANVTGTAKFYYRASGSKTWRYLGASHTESGFPGAVSLEVGGSLDGTFKIVFAAQGDFLGSSGTVSLG